MVVGGFKFLCIYFLILEILRFVLADDHHFLADKLAAVRQSQVLGRLSVALSEEQLLVETGAGCDGAPATLLDLFLLVEHFVERETVERHVHSLLALPLFKRLQVLARHVVLAVHLLLRDRLHVQLLEGALVSVAYCARETLQITHSKYWHRVRWLELAVTQVFGVLPCRVILEERRVWRSIRNCYQCLYLCGIVDILFSIIIFSMKIIK